MNVTKDEANVICVCVCVEKGPAADATNAPQP